MKIQSSLYIVAAIAILACCTTVISAQDVCSLQQLDPLAQPGPLQSQVEFSRSAPIQRLIIGPNAESTLIKLALTNNTNIVWTHSVTQRQAVIDDNNGGYQIYGMDMSQDGTTIVYVTADGIGYNVMKVNLAAQTDLLEQTGRVERANDVLYDSVVLSPSGTEAISVWQSGVYAHNLATGEQIGPAIQYQPRSALDAQVYSDTTIAVQFHDAEDGHEIIVYDLAEDRSEWIVRGTNTSNPTWTAAGFTPFSILNQGNTIASCVRVLEDAEEAVPEFSEVVFWHFDEVSGEWNRGTPDYHGLLDGHPCHTVEFSADETTVMVEYNVDGQELVTVGTFNAATDEWRARASNIVKGNAHITDAFLGNTMFTMDSTGTAFSGIVSGPHPGYPASEYHFALYKVECTNGGNPTDVSNFGCYNTDGDNTCKCTPEVCSADACAAANGFFTDQCRSCTCGGEQAPPDDGESGFGCYNLPDVGRACTCDAEFCSEELCTVADGIWSDSCTTCQCETIVEPEDPPTDTTAPSPANPPLTGPNSQGASTRDMKMATTFTVVSMFIIAMSLK